VNHYVTLAALRRITAQPLRVHGNETANEKGRHSMFPARFA